MAFGPQKNVAALTAQLDGSVNGILDLCCCKCENICAGRGACAVHEAGVIKNLLCGAPQQLLAGLVLHFFAQVYDLFQLLVGFARTAVLRRGLSWKQ